MVAKRYKLPILQFPKDAKVVFQNDHFIVKKNRNTIPHNRIGVTVGKWLLKSAVRRNRVKRAVYAFFQLRREDFFKHHPVGGSIDLLIITKPPIINLTKNKLYHSLEKLYERVI